MKLKTLLMGAIATSALAPAAFAERGSDGNVSIIYWQAPSILNPYLSGGTKDGDASAFVVEPLARYNETGALVPWLAESVPTVDNGGVTADLKQITWKITPGLKWSDGTAFTSADVKFSYDYCTHPEGGCSQLTNYEGVSSVETPDDLTVVVTFENPTPTPYGPFVGQQSPIIQKAQFENCMGAKAPECTTENFGPIGTGPFTVTEFRPNDVVTYAANPNYRDASKPAFATVTLKGGGSAEDSGRAVMETGEFDYGWNLQLAPDVIAKMAEGGKGVPIAGFGPLVERIMLNQTNPSSDLPEGERSTVAHPHPFLKEPAVYKAMSMALDRPLLVEVGYGTAGNVTCNWVPAPAIFNSDTFDCSTQDIAGANAMLDDAGFVDSDGDGVREVNGVPMKILYQTSTNAVRQDFQALIKAWWDEIGIETELRNINASVFFGGDPGSPDTFQKFYADIEMYTNNFAGVDPQAYMASWLCSDMPRPESQWQGNNVQRFCDEGYDALVEEMAGTADLERRGELARMMNDMLVQSGSIIPLIHRGGVSAHANDIGGIRMSDWDSELWNIAEWYRMPE